VKFLVDESCDAIVVRVLNDLEQNVRSVAKEKPGISDREVLQWAYSEQRILITDDRDFSELIYRQNHASHGVILVRISDEHRDDRSRQIRHLIQNHEHELEFAMTTVTRNQIRIRPLPRRRWD
jgi:predicted nuclease of predicted toxin-antitoxin system